MGGNICNISLGQQFSTGGDFASWGHLAMSVNILVVTAWEGGTTGVWWLNARDKD